MTFVVVAAIITHPWEKDSAHRKGWGGLACKTGKHPRAEEAQSAEGITESQNGRGWKGPLWVI